MQSQQLLMESQVLKDELLTGAESAEQPAEQMSELHDHVKNLTETFRVQLCAKSFILQVYDVLARHTRHVRRFQSEEVQLQKLHERLRLMADNIHLQFGTVGVLDDGANDGILDFAVVQVDADFVADLNSRFGSLACTRGNVP